MKEKMKEKKQKGNRYLLPMILVTFIPLIMRYHVMDTKLGTYPWFGESMEVDIFLYFKMIAFIMIASIMTICVIGHIYSIKTSSKSKMKKEQELCLQYSYKIWSPLFVYAILVLLSTLFSQYVYWGYHGMTQQMEPVWVLIGYVVLTYYAYLFVCTAQDVHRVLNWLLISSAVICLIGTFQALGLDFYKTTIGKLTFLPVSLLNQEIEFAFEKGRSYSSLYNPNYVGVYASLLIPIIFTMIFINKNRKMYVVYIASLLLVVVSLFGSGSKTGIFSIFISLLLLCILFAKQLMKQWKLFASGIVVIVLLFFGINALKENALVSSIQNAMKITKSIEPALSAIEMNDDNVTVKYNDNEIIFRYQPEGATVEEQLELADQNGEKIKTKMLDGSRISLEDNRFPDITVGYGSYQEMLFFDFTIDGKAWYFTNQNGDNTYYYLTISGKLDKIKQANVSDFLKGKEKFASGRGFIWSRTIPLLKDYLFLGSGADSFALVYPNDEYVGKYNYGYGEQNITKPHNLYLQIAVQTGVLSLISFLAFYAIYFVTSLRLYIKSGMDIYETQIGAAILTSTFGYMLMGITNDSCIAVAPIYWLLLGMGCAINYQIKQLKKSK